MAICYQCKHFVNLEPTGPRSDVWYNHVCSANTLPRAVNPVTGKEQYVGHNDFGTTVYQDQPYDFCRNHNYHRGCPVWASLQEVAKCP